MKPASRLALLTALLAGLATAPAQAATVIGQTPPPGTLVGCGLGLTTLQVGVAAGNDYRVPAGGGVITAWQHHESLSGGQVSFVVFASDVSGNHATTLAFSDLVAPAVGLNTYPIRIPVSGGERIGLYTPTGSIACAYSTLFPDDVVLTGAVGGPSVGASPLYNQVTGRRTNVAAVVEADADGDKFGDDSQDSCPVDAAIQVPCTPKIDGAPKKKTTARKAKFSFGVPAGKKISFRCSLDGASQAPCTTPQRYRKLKPKKHTFAVQAVDGAGRAGATKRFSWRVLKD
jgi:hypothetical protein